MKWLMTRWHGYVRCLAKLQDIDVGSSLEGAAVNIHMDTHLPQLVN